MSLFPKIFCRSLCAKQLQIFPTIRQNFPKARWWRSYEGYLLNMVIARYSNHSIGQLSVARSGHSVERMELENRHSYPSYVPTIRKVTHVTSHSLGATVELARVSGISSDTSDMSAPRCTVPTCFRAQYLRSSRVDFMILLGSIARCCRSMPRPAVFG